MSNTTIALLLILAVVAIGGGAAMVSGARGIRNHNPGNIRLSSDRWQGLAPTQSDPEFFQFSEPKWGIRALAKLLKNYQARYGLNTVRAIITRWAPPSENDTAAYIANVSQWSGVDPDQIIDVTARLVPLVNSIIRQENGRNPYPPALLFEGIGLA